MEIKGTYKDGTLEISNYSDSFGGWLIRVNSSNIIRLYEVPMYGGEERYVDTYPNIMEAIKEGESWS